jgi:hypothetical protein
MIDLPDGIDYRDRLPVLSEVGSDVCSTASHEFLLAVSRRRLACCSGRTETLSTHADERRTWRYACRRGWDCPLRGRSDGESSRRRFLGSAQGGEAVSVVALRVGIACGLVADNRVDGYGRVRSRRPKMATRIVSPAISATTPAPATTHPVVPLLASGDMALAAIAHTPSAVATVATPTSGEPRGALSLMSARYHRASQTICSRRRRDCGRSHLRCLSPESWQLCARWLVSSEPMESGAGCRSVSFDASAGHRLMLRRESRRPGSSRSARW